MNKLDGKSAEYAVSPTLAMNLQTAGRLIVLVSEFESDPAFVARKIRDVAKALESRVQLIGLSADAAREPGIRRQLVTLSALVEDATIFVDTHVEFGSNWVNVVWANWHPGDVVVCFAGKYAGTGSKPLSQILQSSLNVPLYVLSDIQLRTERQRPAWFSSVMAWSGSISLILGFFWVQAKLLQPVQGGIQAVLLYGSLILEAGSIWFWNDLFR